MAPTVQLAAAVYTDRQGGGSVFQALQDMHGFETIRLLDAALIEKRDDGKLHVVAVADHAHAGGHGRAIKSLIRRIFPRHLSEDSREAIDVDQATAMLDDFELDAATLHSLVDGLPPGGALVLALAEAEWQRPIEATLRGFEGQLVHIELGPDAAAVIVAASNDRAEG